MKSTLSLILILTLTLTHAKSLITIWVKFSVILMRHVRRRLDTKVTCLQKTQRVIEMLSHVRNIFDMCSMACIFLNDSFFNLKKEVGQ